MTTPKLSESIPAVTRPVRLPRIVPGRASFIANIVTGGVLAIIAGGMLAYYFMVVA